MGRHRSQGLRCTPARSRSLGAVGWSKGLAADLELRACGRLAVVKRFARRVVCRGLVACQDDQQVQAGWPEPNDALQPTAFGRG